MSFLIFSSRRNGWADAITEARIVQGLKLKTITAVERRRHVCSYRAHRSIGLQWGALALKQQLTLVLPMYNKERQIRSTVHDLLDLSVSIKAEIDLVIVDDGSTDDTFESACELARMYPRIQVLRQPFRSGLSSVLELVRNRLSVEMVIVHDGVSPVDPAELKQLLMNDQNLSLGPSARDTQTVESIDSHGSRRFAAVRALHDDMEVAHRRALGFTWLRLEKPLVPRRRQVVEPARTTSPVLTSLTMGHYLANLPTGFSSVPLL